ncbi:proline-rich protein HaeIII subfamily 1-like [Camelus dromedarius]|uniref:proline-rich protein HaeIII subfamily 1-like n=1 Tax=Camelus dromedarius TaxID=9838 RepID=UPI00311A739A
MELTRPRPDNPSFPPPPRPLRPARPHAALKLRLTRARPPYLRPGWSGADSARVSLRVAAGPAGTSRSAPPGARPRPAPAATRHPAGPAQALGAATRTPAGEIEEQPPRGLRSLTRQRVPEASATDRVPPTPTRTYRSWRQERPRLRHGVGLRGAQRPPTRARGGRGVRESQQPSPLRHLRCPLPQSLPVYCPLSHPIPRALTGLARSGPAQQYPQLP